ncbi:hypothetical protein KEM55_005877 [Ascosphaera atra]|nr:hypothetical protein KEM55_005877 [Ascosphaera atra]
MPPAAEVLVHVGAPSSARDDSNYRAQAQACLDFEGVSSSGFDDEDTTDVFASYVPGATGKSDRKASTATVKDDTYWELSRNDDAYPSTREELTEAASEYSATGSSQSAHQAYWVPLDESATEVTSSAQLQSRLTETAARGLQRTGIESTAEDYGQADVDDMSSFATPPSVVLDSQQSIATEKPSNHPNGLGIGGFQSQPEATSEPLADASSVFLPLDTQNPSQVITSSAPNATWVNEVEASKTPAKRKFQRVSLDSTHTVTEADVAATVDRRDSQVTLTSQFSASAVETNQTPAPAKLQSLPLRTSFTSQSFASQQSSFNEVPKRRRLSPSQPGSPSATAANAEGRDVDDPPSFLLRSDSLSSTSSFVDFVSSFPMESFPPEPKVSSTPRYKTHVTRALSMIAERVRLERLYKPRIERRPLDKVERGHWCFKLDISNEDRELATTGASSMRSKARGSKSLDNAGATNSNTWHRDQFQQFWEYLTQFISAGRAGWGTWCACELLDTEASTTLARRSGASAHALAQLVTVEVKVYTWGELVPFIWVLLYIASDRLVRKVTGVAFKDGRGEKVIEMG